MPDDPTFIALTPTTRPSRSTKGPPELPGLIAASCCTHLVKSPVRPRSKAISSTSSPPSTVKTRSVLLTMPSVTERDRAKGEPMAITVSPTTSRSESPKAATGSFSPGAELRGVDADHGQVRQRVFAHERRGQFSLVGERDAELASVVDHVLVGQHVAVLAEDGAAACRAALGLLPAPVRDGDDADIDERG
jgi:hypothetical protein